MGARAAPAKASNNRPSSSNGASPDALADYRRKRDFTKTPEPAEGGAPGTEALQFVIQKHWASRLHYDLRLELDGTMKSWAVPKGPSLDPSDKRMAVQVEDHPISYNTFEGQIPPNQYGAGKVIVWDRGYWVPVGDAAEGYIKGKLKFELHGHKLHGHWTLVRMHGKSGEKQPPWLLIKEHDAFERPAVEFSVVDEQPDSVSALPPVSTPGSAGKPAAPRASRPTAEKSPHASLPAKLAPQLATLVDGPPARAEDWLWELKFDGYRLMARVEKGKTTFYTRNGNDWTAKMPELAQEIARLPISSAWLDGEVIIMDHSGVPDFQALQNAFDGKASKDLVFYAFDLPFLNGHDLRGLPNVERRAALASVLADAQSETVRFSADFEASPKDLVASACKIGFEGVIGKRKEGLYVSKRSSDWIKLKCTQRQEFVIGGYTEPKGARGGLGALLLGVHGGDGSLRYAGSVGSGFSDRVLAELHGKLVKIGAEQCPFADAKGVDKKAHWVKPVLLAEVAFAEWTKEGKVRHAVFHGLRSDKPATAIVRERPTHVEGDASEVSTKLDSAGLKISNPERVIDASTGITKLELARYYSTVAPFLMEHLAGRPVSFVRAPEGIGGELFFQKHLDKAAMKGVVQLRKELHEGHQPLLEVEGPEGLVSAAQMNVVEFHTWNARKDRIERPDRITFDLDPGDGVPWAQMQEAAVLVQVLLKELGLPAFLKTSGGKGLHVVVPIKRLHDWETAKGFSQAVVQHLAATIPQRFVAKMGPRNRIGKIFVDYLRNGFGATTASAWSARARPGMGISVPISWNELDKVASGAHWTVRTAGQRLRAGNSPWEGYASAATSLTRPIAALTGGRKSKKT